MVGRPKGRAKRDEDEARIAELEMQLAQFNGAVADVGPGDLEFDHPEKAAEAMHELAVNPSVRAADLAKLAGMPVGVMKAFLKKYETRYLPLKQELHKITQKDLTDVIEDKIWRVLAYMNDNALMDATLRDLGFTFDRLMNARQLLKGEPTSILAWEDRRKLNELLPALILESRRRGIIVDGQVAGLDNAQPAADTEGPPSMALDMLPAVPAPEGRHDEIAEGEFRASP